MFKKLTLVAAAATIALSATLSAAPAMAFPNGPKDFQNKPQPKLPGPPKGPGDFKLPPKGPGPKGGHNHNAAFGALIGVGVLTAAAMAASAAADDECWQEERYGELVTVCIDR